ncbi:MAG: mechanosensitive ion channel [Candidatus Pacebacteria bacterium]|nr:mechanosensitive ion channel [Candidatus Paceibacterota bacterium]
MSAIRQFIDPFLQKLGAYLPSVFGAIIVLIAGWVLAYLVAKAIKKLLSWVKLDERLARDSEAPRKFETFLTRLVYYVLLLCVFLLVLDILGVQGVLDPARNMFDKALQMFPNFLAAILIGVIGFIIAKMMAAAVEALTGGVDSIVKRAGVSEEFKLSRLLSQLTFIFIFIPILIAALDALKIEAISVPATDMLDALMSAVPNIVAAGIILTVAFFLGRFVAHTIRDLLSNMGADKLPEKLHVQAMFTEGYPFSRFTGDVVMFFIILAALISAAEKLEMPLIAGLLTQLTMFAGQVALGLAILAIGNMIAGLIYRALNQSEEPSFLAVIARYAVIGLVLAIGLRAMGIANDIILVAFALSLGAIATGAAFAVALAFGLGGREAAGKQMEYWLRKMRKDESQQGS